VPLKVSIPARIPILYVILGVLVAISVVPMYFYSAQVERDNRERLKTNEKLLQNTVTRSLADEISQHEASLRLMLGNESSAIQIASAGDISGAHVERPELRALLENFVSSSADIAYATLLNADAKGISAGRIAPDAFLRRELERGFAAARENRIYNGQALVVGSGKSARTVVLVSSPVMYSGQFVGMIGSVVDLDFLIRRLEEVRRSGLTPYVVDAQGRLVAASHSDYATGQDMKNLEIVKNFVDEGSKAQLAATKEFTIQDGKESTEMLGTYSPVTELDWAVVVQKPRLEAYQGVFEMQHTARLLALAAVLASIMVSFYAARRIAAGCKGEGQASLELEDGSQSPVIGDIAQPAVFFPGRVCHRIHDKAVTHVVNGIAVIRLKVNG